MEKKIKCPLCGEEKNSEIYQVEKTNLSRYGLQINETKNKNEIDRKIKINYCKKCYYGWNKEFENKKVNYKKENIIEAGKFSKEYLSYQMMKAKELSNYTKSKIFETAVEIGAGAGLFIKEVNSKNKIAFEPSKEALQIDKNIKVINDYFYGGKNNIKADIVIMRQVLEHIENPKNYIKEIIKTFTEKNNELILYIEVPNADKTFKLGRFYDIYYEHCNYFSLNSLVKLGVELDLEIIKISKDYDDEILSIVYRKNTKINIKKILNENEKNLKYLIYEKYKGKKIIGWGASGNGAAIINKLKINKNIISHIIDSDKNKQGKKIPGMGQPIIGYENLKELNPEVVFIFSQFHKREIEAQINKLRIKEIKIEVI